MLREDIYTIDITEEMIAEARAEQQWLGKNKQGANTRDVTSDRDLIGSLAHQAVEIAFEMSMYDYVSTRKTQYKHGDAFDIKFVNDCLDIKGTRGKVSEQWYFNRGFLVFQAQVDDPKFKEITHLVFVEVDLQGMQASIYGVISRPEFLQKCRQLKAGENRLQYDNLEIKAKDLMPIRKYIHRT